MENQIAKQFDAVTIQKIIKGALIASTGAGVLYILNWAKDLDLGAFTPLLVAIVPIVVNGIKEWMRGT